MDDAAWEEWKRERGMVPLCDTPTIRRIADEILKFQENHLGEMPSEWVVSKADGARLCDEVRMLHLFPTGNRGGPMTVHGVPIVVGDRGQVPN